MPAVIESPEVLTYTEHGLSEEQPQTHTAPRGFWHTVVAYVGRHRAHRLHRTPSSSHRPLHPIEAPADLLAREYPSLYIRAYAGV